MTTRWQSKRMRDCSIQISSDIPERRLLSFDQRLQDLGVIFVSITVTPTDQDVATGEFKPIK